MFKLFSRQSAEVVLATRTPVEKVQFHIQRYDLAIEQCRKGPERMAQLKRERDFWRSVAKAQAEPGGE